MDKKVNAERLLRAMSNVDDKYIQEAMDTSAAPAKRAVTTSLRRYTPVIGIIAAALLLLVAGSAVMRFMSASAPAPAADHAVDAEAAAEENNSLDVRGGTMSEGLTANVEAVEGADTYDLSLPTEANDNVSDGTGMDPANPMIEADSLADLADMAGFDIQVPDSVEGSDSCRYFFYDADGGLSEVVYLDEDGNVICTIRKASGDRNVSGNTTCYSVARRVEVEGIGSVNLSGSGRGFALAYWTCGEYSYSIATEEMIAEEAILELVSQVN